VDTSTVDKPIKVDANTSNVVLGNNTAEEVKISMSAINNIYQLCMERMLDL
jgi:hypothetical protein